MPRPFCHRHVSGRPAASIFKPAGIPRQHLDEVVMTLDEFEAFRLTGLDRMYHDQAAAQMQVSRPTFSRILESAHAKVADVLVHGKALRIDGGPIQVMSGPRQCCRVHNPAPEKDPTS